MKLEINKQDSSGENIEILIDIPFGKNYLSNLSERKDQNSQKGETCFYKALNSPALRKKWGKAFDSLDPMRAVEIKISRFKKELAKLTYLEKVSEAFVNGVGVNSIDKDFVKTFLQQRAGLISKNHKEALLKVLNAFIAQTAHNDFKIFLQNYLTELKINEQTLFLKKFNIDARQLVSEHLKQVADYFKKIFPNKTSDINKIIDISKLSKQDYCNLLNKLITCEIAKQYKLNFSTWEPSQGFKGLRDTIEKNGALFVSLGLNEAFYNNQAFKAGHFGKRELYTWNDSVYAHAPLKSGETTHTVVIIGLQKIKNEEYVFFLDPNYPNTANGPNKIFKIPYQYFVRNLHNVYGDSTNKAVLGQRGPFGFQADQKYLDYLEDFYTAYNQFRKDDSIDDEVESNSIANPNSGNDKKYLDYLEEFNSAYNQFRKNDSIDDEIELNSPNSGSAPSTKLV